MRHLEAVLALSAVLCFPAQAGPAHAHLDAEGYRASRYRAPTPGSVPGAQTLDTDGLLALIRRESPVLVDVQPVTVRPETRDFGIAWLPSRVRHNIEGSLWLPNVGYARLDPHMARYFRDQLERATGGDADHPVVFYCVADCWLSWNAVQRAARLGYTRLFWYKNGTDGWLEHGLPLVRGTPVPIEPEDDR